MSRKARIVAAIVAVIGLGGLAAALSWVRARQAPDDTALKDARTHMGEDHGKADPHEHDHQEGEHSGDSHAEGRSEGTRDHDEHEAHNGHGDHAGHDEHGHEEHEEGVVRLNEAHLSGLALTHVKVKRGSLTTMVELPGEVAWNADRLVHISPRVSGIVSSVAKTLGDPVEAGNQLCVLDSREMGDAKMEYLADLGRFEVARADHERARIVYENTKRLLAILDPEPAPEEVLAQAHDLPVGDNKNKLLTSYTRMKVNFRNYRRNEELLASKIASEAEFLEAQGDYEVSRADYLSTREEISFDLELRFLRAEKDFKVARTETRNAKRALHILGLTHEQTTEIAQHGDEIDTDISRNVIYSPINGLIVERHLTRGELVNTDTRLYTIADLSNVWVMGRVYERDIRALDEGQKATVRLNAFPGELFEGVVDYIGSRLDPDTRTVQARVVLPNPERRFRAGMFAIVTVFTPRKGEASTSAPASLLVPISALQRVEDGHVVFRVVEEGVFKAVRVQVVATSQGSAEVKGELLPDDVVVIGDTFTLKSVMGLEGMSGGHAGHGH